MSNTKVVVITGVSSAIGRATAMKFAKQGRRVFGTVRNTEKAQAIPGVALAEMDIRDEASVQRGVQTIIAQAKRIDVLVTSAGVTLVGATEETSSTEAQTLFDANLFGFLRTSQAVLPHMREQRSGRIVNVAVHGALFGIQARRRPCTAVGLPLCWTQRLVVRCNPRYQPGCSYTTAELSINIVRPASHKTGPLRATGRLIHGGGRLATAEARIEDEQGKLYARRRPALSLTCRPVG